jgi:hypothetical protein
MLTGIGDLLKRFNTLGELSWSRITARSEQPWRQGHRLGNDIAGLT